jgi:hypothetical protein
MEQEFGLKELYELTFRATSQMEVGNRIFEEGEAIMAFDKVQIANFQELSKRVTAHGGVGDLDRVFWDDPKGLNLTFSQGIFSTTQFALMSNSKIVNNTPNTQIVLWTREKLESDENGFITLKEEPAGDFFIYNGDTFEKLSGELTDSQIIQISTPYTNVIIDYQYFYTNESTSVIIGQQAIKGYLSVQGKTRVKDDITGQVKTGIIKLPKVKLMSDLSMRLGEKANPMVANFTVMAYPVGNYGRQRIMEMHFLTNDIDADI